MQPAIARLYQRTYDWASGLVKSGWITALDGEALENIEHRQVEHLFRTQSIRPLIVALFGGTGVGKSSLLNRLAGETIARVGVERPTSQTVTLYLHRDFRGNLIPDELPTAGTQIAWHHDENRRLVAWLDMPDFDSTEHTHRDQVVAWLPYVDWLIYVVSPERYQDDLGWRFLHERGQRHGWLFVMNHWDQGVSAQLDDFKRRLRTEGFENPVVLRTSCVEPAIEDDFATLEQTIRDALKTFGLEVLQRVGAHARAGDLEVYLQGISVRLGDDAAWQALARDWSKLVRAGLGELEKQLQSQLATLTQRHLTDDASLQRHLRDIQSGGESNRGILEYAWQPRNDTRLTDLNLTLVNRIQQSGMTQHPAFELLRGFVAHARESIRVTLEAKIAEAFAKPGTALQRSLHHAAEVASWFLPLLASLWVVYVVVDSFAAGTRGEQSFLGINYAVHSALLIGLAWLIPWLLRRATRPSLAQSVQAALSTGAEQSIERVAGDYAALWERLGETRAHHRREHAELLAEVRGLIREDAHRPKQFHSQGSTAESP
ncbi:MAG: hypothetical protein ACFCUJ_00175 [Thiotrichales bacterium]